MMKLLAMVLFVGFALTTYYCQNENQGNRELDLITVFLDSIRKNVYYSEVFEEISYVVLHGMPEDEAIAELEKIFKFDDGFICWDQQRRAIYIFDNDGMYVRHIRAIGDGPKEYVDIGDMCYNEADQCIYVIDRASYLVKYNLNGEGIDKKILPKLTSNLIADSEGNILFYSNPKVRNGVMDQCVLWYLKEDGTTDCVDMNGNVINKFYLISEFKFSKSSSQSDLFFNTPLSYNIYSVKDEKMVIRYEFDIGEREKLNKENYGEMSFYEQIDYRNGPAQLTIPLGQVFAPESWIVSFVLLKYDIGLWNKPTSYHPYEYILFHPDIGTFSSHSLIDDDENYFYWWVKGAYDNVLIHHMYYQDVERAINEGINLRTENGGRVLHQLDATSEVLMLMKLKTVNPSS